MEKLQITMFGDFTLACGGRIISDKTRRSRKMWKLLGFLMVNRRRDIAQKELVRLLWGEDILSSETGALKTQVHRIRAELAKLGLQQEIIVSRGSSYAFNMALDCVFDTEGFDKLYAAARAEQELGQRLLLVTKLCGVFRGVFLPKLSDEEWVKPLAEDYSARFFELLEGILPELEKAGRLSDMILLAEDGISVDPFREKLHGALIMALAATGNRSGARTQFHYVVNLFHTKLGRSPSPEFRQIYIDLFENSENKTAGLYDVMEVLSEKYERAGAFKCSYEAFKRVYQLEMRYMSRCSRKVCVILLTVRSLGKKEAAVRAATLLEDTLGKSLRISDLYARYSDTQYVVLLHDIEQGHAGIVIDRIKKAFPEASAAIRAEVMPLQCLADEEGFEERAAESRVRK